MRKYDAVTLWLYTCCGMIFVMALIGAITRLTESGLSITRWEPITGALPPMSVEAWNKAFADYQAIPQYRIFNSGMNLHDFKHIYFWEWFHRLWGRLIGMVLALPLVYFYVTKKITRALMLRLLVIFALGGMQGFIGWFMVQSGLEVRASVSPYRLALHLSFALLLYALLLWTALGRRQHQPLTARYGLFIQGWITLGFLSVTILWGALVAGLRAGGAYNTWPLMDGAFLPDAAFSLQPAWLNMFENTALVQFIHRWLGPTTMLLIFAWVVRCWRSADAEQKVWLRALAATSVVQVALGLGTLLSHVEIVVAVAHQAGAITLLTLLLVNLYGMTPRRK